MPAKSSGLGQELKRERNAAEQARIEVAQGRLVGEAQRIHPEELRGELARLDDDCRQKTTGRYHAERDWCQHCSARRVAAFARWSHRPVAADLLGLLCADCERDRMSGKCGRPITTTTPALEWMNISGSHPPAGA